MRGPSDMSDPLTSGFPDVKQLRLGGTRLEQAALLTPGRPLSLAWHGVGARSAGSLPSRKALLPGLFRIELAGLKPAHILEPCPVAPSDRYLETWPVQVNRCNKRNGKWAGLGSNQRPPACER